MAVASAGTDGAQAETAGDASGYYSASRIALLARKAYSCCLEVVSILVYRTYTSVRTFQLHCLETVLIGHVRLLRRHEVILHVGLIQVGDRT